MAYMPPSLCLYIYTRNPTGVTLPSAALLVNSIMLSTETKIFTQQYLFMYFLECSFKAWSFDVFFIIVVINCVDKSLHPSLTTEAGRKVFMGVFGRMRGAAHIKYFEDKTKEARLRWRARLEKDAEADPAKTK